MTLGQTGRGDCAHECQNIVKCTTVSSSVQSVPKFKGSESLYIQVSLGHTAQFFEVKVEEQKES